MKINVVDFEKKYLNPKINRIRKALSFLEFVFLLLSSIVSVFVISPNKFILFSFMGFFLTFTIDYILYFIALDFTKLEELEKTYAIERSFRMMSIFVALSVMILTAIIALIFEITRNPLANDLISFVIISMPLLLVFVFAAINIKVKTTEEKITKK